MTNSIKSLTFVSKLQSRRLIKFIFCAVFLFIIEKSQIPWHLIKNSFVGIYFVDSKYLLDHSFCVANDWSSLYSVNSICSSVPYIYGFLPIFVLYALSFLSISVGDIANLQMVLAIFGFSYFASSLKTKYSILFIIALMLPPTSLLFERGNLDLIIAAGLFLVSHLFNTGKRYSCMALATFLALLKFYPACIFIYLLFGPRKEKVTKLEFAMYSFASLLITWNFSLVNRSSLPSSWDQSYGVGVLHALSKMSGLGLPAIVILAVLVAVLAISFGMGKRTGTVSLSLKPEFHIFGIVYIATYLAGFNYDYRLFTMIVCSFCLLQEARISRSLRAIILIGLFTGLLFSNPAGLNIQSTNIELVISGISEIINFILATVFAYFFGHSTKRAS